MKSIARLPMLSTSQMTTLHTLMDRIIPADDDPGAWEAAGVLAEAGKRVLLLERGPHLATAATAPDHLRNQRLSLYGHNAGPELEGNPRVAVGADGQARLVRPIEGAYQNNAAVVG